MSVVEDIVKPSNGLVLTRLGDVVDRLTNGFVGPTRDIYQAEGVPYLLARHVKNNRLKFDGKTFVTDEFNAKHSKSILKQGDVLLVQSGHVGESTVVPAEHEGHNCHAMIVISPTKGELHGKYLSHYWHTPKGRAELKRIETGATLKHLNCRDVKELEIPLPPLREQKRIAGILDKADAIRRKRQQAIGLTEQFLRSTFLDMFGDPVTNPKNLPIGTIRDLVTEVKYGTSGKANLTEGEFPVLRMNNITYEGTWDLESLKYCDIPKRDQEKYLVRKGDLLFNRTNSKELVGKTAVFQESRPMAYAGYLIRVRTNDKALTSFISGYLNSPFGKAKLRHMCKSIVGMANINAQELQDIEIIMPSIKEQHRYVEIVESCRLRTAKFCKALDDADNLFSSLVQLAFRGEL